MSSPIIIIFGVDLHLFFNTWSKIPQNDTNLLLTLCHPMSDVLKHFHSYDGHILTSSLTLRSQPLHASTR